jgi:hypothetical protein
MFRRLLRIGMYLGVCMRKNTNKINVFEHFLSLQVGKTEPASGRQAA